MPIDNDKDRRARIEQQEIHEHRGGNPPLGQHEAQLTLGSHPRDRRSPSRTPGCSTVKVRSHVDRVGEDDRRALTRYESDFIKAIRAIAQAGRLFTFKGNAAKAATTLDVPCLKKIFQRGRLSSDLAARPPSVQGWVLSMLPGRPSIGTSRIRPRKDSAEIRSVSPWS